MSENRLDIRVIEKSKKERKRIITPVLNGYKTQFYSAFKNFEEKGVFDVIGTQLDITTYGKLTKEGWKSLHAAMSIYRNKNFETFRYLFIDKYGNLQDQCAVSCRMPNTSVNGPNETFLYNLITYAEQKDYYIAICHNHPSGNPTPSNEDINLTDSINKGLTRTDGLNRFLGHIILDHDTFTVAVPTRERGPVWHEWDQTQELPDYEKDIDFELFGANLNSYYHLVDVAKKINDTESWNDEYIPVLFSDGKLKSIQYFSYEVFLNEPELIKDTLKESAILTGATQWFPVFTEHASKKISRENLFMLEQNCIKLVKINGATDISFCKDNDIFTICEKYGLSAGHTPELFFDRNNIKIETQTTFTVPEIDEKMFPFLKNIKANSLTAAESVVKENTPEYETVDDISSEYLAKRTDKLSAKLLWERLGNIPIDDNENIDEPFIFFEKGTDRFEIWHWFEEHYNISVAEELMYANLMTKEEEKMLLNSINPDKTKILKFHPEKTLEPFEHASIEMYFDEKGNKWNALLRLQNKDTVNLSFEASENDLADFWYGFKYNGLEYDMNICNGGDYGNGGWIYPVNADGQTNTLVDTELDSVNIYSKERGNLEIWTWIDYDDLSGHLVAPDGKSYFSYDWTTKEYKFTDESIYDSFIDADPTRDTSLEAFKSYAQDYIREHFIKNKDEKILFARKYIDIEKEIEEDKRKEIQNETLAQKYERLKKFFTDVTTRIGPVKTSTFEQTVDWQKEQNLDRGEGEYGILLDAVSRMILDNADFDSVDYRNFDDVYGFDWGASVRWDVSDTVAKDILSGNILDINEVQYAVYSAAEKKFEEIKNNPIHKSDIEIIDRINAAFRISQQLYPEYAELYEHDVPEDDFYNYSSSEKKAYIEKVWESLKTAFENKKADINKNRADEIIIKEESGNKTLLCADFAALIKGRDAVLDGEKSLYYKRPDADSIAAGLDSGWDFSTITTSYGEFSDFHETSNLPGKENVINIERLVTVLNSKIIGEKITMNENESVEQIEEKLDKELLKLLNKLDDLRIDSDKENKYARLSVLIPDSELKNLELFSDRARMNPGEGLKMFICNDYLHSTESRFHIDLFEYHNPSYGGTDIGVRTENLKGHISIGESPLPVNDPSVYKSFDIYVPGSGEKEQLNNKFFIYANKDIIIEKTIEACKQRQEELHQEEEKKLEEKQKYENNVNDIAGALGLTENRSTAKEKKLSFADDIDKMRDFDLLSKEEFLSSYSYLTEEEYDATAAELKEKGLTGKQMVEKLEGEFDLEPVQEEVENLKEQNKELSFASKLGLTQLSEPLHRPYPYLASTSQDGGYVYFNFNLDKDSPILELSDELKKLKSENWREIVVTFGSEDAFEPYEDVSEPIGIYISGPVSKTQIVFDYNNEGKPVFPLGKEIVESCKEAVNHYMNIHFPGKTIKEKFFTREPDILDIINNEVSLTPVQLQGEKFIASLNEKLPYYKNNPWLVLKVISEDMKKNNPSEYELLTKFFEEKKLNTREDFNSFFTEVTGKIKVMEVEKKQGINIIPKPEKIHNSLEKDTDTIER